METVSGNFLDFFKDVRPVLSSYDKNQIMAEKLIYPPIKAWLLPQPHFIVMSSRTRPYTHVHRQRRIFSVLNIGQEEV